MQLISFPKINTNILEVIASDAILPTFNEDISIYENPEPKFFIKNFFYYERRFSKVLGHMWFTC